MADLDIRIIPALSDNYIYLLGDPARGEAAVVDPSIAGPVLQALEETGWHLVQVLCTHHHMDHIGGAAELKRVTGCRLIGSDIDRTRIPGLDDTVGEGDIIQAVERPVRVLGLPGHTAGHVAYIFDDDNALFCGDVLFSLGCGRLFEGSPGEMWKSLDKLRALPDTMRVFCGHEYTAANAQFALTVEPDNAVLAARTAEVAKLRRNGQPTLPSTIGAEKAANPFLRADRPEIARALGLDGANAETVFAEMRRRKDHF